MSRASESSEIWLVPASESSTRSTDFNQVSPLDGLNSLPSRFTKSIDFNLTITNKTGFKRCISATISVLVFIPVLVLLLHFFTREQSTDKTPKDLTLALSQALLFFDAQKSGNLPEDNPVKFRGDSGLHDGSELSSGGDLVGGFYDSGNNIKFSFTTAYTVTLLSWTVVEYHKKYEDIGEIDHVKEIVKWGTDFLLKVVYFLPNNSAILYSQVGGGNKSGGESDVTCWQRPEDMAYPRPVSVCNEKTADLAGEIIAAMSAASLVFSSDKPYSQKLVKTAEALFSSVTNQVPSHELGKLSENQIYNSSGYIDELVWGTTWLFFATGNSTYLKYATDNFFAAEDEELPSEEGVFYWNNKLTATALLMTRIRYFIDLGYPYEDALATNRTDLLMCWYLHTATRKWGVSNGGLILLKPDIRAPLQYAATAAFLGKLYSDLLQLLQRMGGSCGADVFSIEMLFDFSMSQVSYILGDNPMKMSYLVGYNDRYPNRVHHRAASIPVDGKKHSCSEGGKYLNSKGKNPNIIAGAMVGGPDKNDMFLDDRDKPWFTEPSIAGNAGLVAALVALHGSPIKSVGSGDGSKLRIDKIGIFQNVHLGS